MNLSETNSAQMPRKAMLLAAGLGTRLRPFTETVSKCMIPIAGKPLLEHTIGLLHGYGFTDLMINLHHLPQTVIDHFADGGAFGIQVKYSLETELVGTAGAVKKVEQFFDGPFLVWYADNLSTCRLDRLWQFHLSKGGVATIALHHRDDPTQSGIVGLDENDRVTRFLEKPSPDQVFSHWINAGISILEPEVLAAIPDGRFCDFGRDVFPSLLEQGSAIFGYRMSESERLWWIDTAEDLAKVEVAFGVESGKVKTE